MEFQRHSSSVPTGAFSGAAIQTTKRAGRTSSLASRLRLETTSDRASGLAISPTNSRGFQDRQPCFQKELEWARGISQLGPCLSEPDAQARGRAEPLARASGSDQRSAGFRTVI